jgi:hypothetical protein
MAALVLGVVLGRVQLDRPAEAGVMVVPVMMLHDEHVS